MRGGVNLLTLIKFESLGNGDYLAFKIRNYG